MTKIELIELIQHRLAGGDLVPDQLGRFHEKVIEKYVSLAVASLMNQLEKNAIKHNDFGQLDDYTITRTEVPVLYDNARKEYYSILPVKVVKLYKNRGIRLVSPNHDQANRFDYMDNNESDVYSELEVEMIDGTPSWYPESNKVYFRNITQPVIDSGVLMKLIPVLSELPDDQEISIPAGQETFVLDFIFKYMSNMPPEDVSNDNNSRQV
jgi:hypothetical protein